MQLSLVERGFWIGAVYFNQFWHLLSPLSIAGNPWKKAELYDEQTVELTNGRTYIYILINDKSAKDR